MSSHTIFLLIILIDNFSFLFCLLPPIPVLPYTEHSFHLNDSSKYIIYSYYNEKDSTDAELVFRFYSAPTEDTKLFLYYSINDVSDNINSLIKYLPEYNQFSSSFYDINLKKDLSSDNVELVLNSNKCDNKYLKPGFIYAVVCITSKVISKYESTFVAFSTEYNPVLSISKPYEFFRVGGPYKKNISFYIPELSEDIILRLESYSLAMFTRVINIFQNEINEKPLITKYFNNTSNFEYYFNLSKGYSYYVQFKYIDRPSKIEDILFQFPSNKFVGIDEDKIIYTSTFINFNNYFFYYDSTNLNYGDSVYLKIIQKDDIDLKYKEFENNNYDFLYNRRKEANSGKLCDKKIIEIDNTTNVKTFFYKCKKQNANSNAFIFALMIQYPRSSFPNLPNQQIEIFLKKNMTNPDNIKKNYKKGQIAYYLLNMDYLNLYYNKNILIYTNINQFMNLYCFDFDIFQTYSNYNIYNDLRLFFLDPSKPEADYYTIFLYNQNLEEYYLDIKLVDKNLYFINEFNSPLEEKMVRKSYYNNETSNNIDIFKIIKYEKNNTEEYAIFYQELYGNFETEMIILDNINAKSFKEILNDDMSFKKEYSLPLSDFSILGKTIWIHIKINSQKSIPSFYDHIAFYENIFKINYSYTINLSEGEEKVIFLDYGKPITIYFDTPFSDFNYEIKFLGKINTNKYSVGIHACGFIKKGLNYNNQIIRGRCYNIDENSYIKLTNSLNVITGIIIKRAFPIENLEHSIITNSLDNYLKLNNSFTAIKYEKDLENLYYFFNEILILDQIINNICIYQEYSDINYIAYPHKYSCNNKKEYFNSYEKLSVDYDIIYNKNTAKGRINEEDCLLLIINTSNSNIELYFKKIFKINVTSMESEFLINKNIFDRVYYFMPGKTQVNNYDYLFLQIFKETNKLSSYYLYKDSLIISKFEIENDSYNTFDLSEINEGNQLYLYTEFNTYTILRFKLYNSKLEEYNNYNYESNLITKTGLDVQIKDKVNDPFKIEIKPKYPHEINGCSNYYFFILDPIYNISINKYNDFKNLNSSVFFQNFTSLNVCSSNSDFLENDLDKFTFYLEMKQRGNIAIFGYSEQINYYKAIKFLSSINFYYNYPSTIKLNDSVLFNLDEKAAETLQLTITCEDEGALNIFWKGSDSNKIQDIEIYNNISVSKENLIYKSLDISNYEHNYSFLVNEQNKYLFIYKSINDTSKRMVYFVFTHKLGKEFGFEKKEDSNWIVYTSGIYNFYTKIDINDEGFENKINAYRYKLKNRNYDSIFSIKVSYLKENEDLIKSYEIHGNTNKKFIESENSIFYYFTLEDNLKYMTESNNLKYIQIEFNLKFKDEEEAEAFDELSIERIPVKKIKDKNWNNKIKDLIIENNGLYGIYYIDTNEEIFNSKQDIIFYTNAKNFSDMLFYGNFLDFTLNKNNISEYVYHIDKKLFVFNEETKNKYKTKNDNNIILLVIDGTSETSKIYSDHEFLEFNFKDSTINHIRFNENGNRSEIFKPEEIFSITDKNECNKKKYYITYYPELEKEKTKLIYSKNINGNIDFYYVNETLIFSDFVESIDDILPGKDDKFSINQHPSEIINGNLDIFAISCQTTPALSILYSFDHYEKDNIISFSLNNNKFIGYFYPENLNYLNKTFNFVSEKEDFKSILKICKTIGLLNIKIFYRKNNSDEFKEIKEGDEIIIESNKLTSTFKIDQKGIGQGVVFFEIIKEIKKNDEKINFDEKNIFENKLYKDNFAILKYTNTQITKWAKIILINEKNQIAKVYIKSEFYTENFISLLDCNQFIEINKNSNITIKINNPYLTNSINLRDIQEMNHYLYTIIKTDSEIKYVYAYSFNSETLYFNSLKNISGSGEFQFELENGSSEKKFIIYQINKCNPTNKVYLSFWSDNYEYDNNIIYGIKEKKESNKIFSLINEGETNEKIDLYFTLCENDNNNEKLNDIINKDASFSYNQIENTLVFTIENFAKDEFEYYSIITRYNNINNLSNFCFFKEFFNNNTNNTLFSKNKAKGKGLDSETKIIHNINEECFTQNCTIMVFAKSLKNNLNKIYSPKTLNVLKKYKIPENKDKDDEDKKDNNDIITILVIIVIIILIIIGIGIFFIMRKFRNNSNNINLNINITSENEMNVITSDNKNEEENQSNPNYLNPLLKEEKNKLKKESENVKKITIHPKVNKISIGINLEDDNSNF